MNLSLKCCRRTPAGRRLCILRNHWMFSPIKLLGFIYALYYHTASRILYVFVQIKCLSLSHPTDFFSASTVFVSKTHLAFLLSVWAFQTVSCFPLSFSRFSSSVYYKTSTSRRQDILFMSFFAHFPVALCFIVLYSI